MLRDWRIWALAATALAVRIAFIFIHGIDSDEPQHLHVAWAWSRGLVQYRDVFDNHFPLLHLLFAPLMAIVPESSTVFLIARLAILPFAIGCSWLLYLIAQPLLGSRAAATAAILLSVMPPWLQYSVEFRNDTLWVFFWLAAVALMTRKRYALAGVAAALCLLASIKAAPLLLAHILASASLHRGVERRTLMRFATGAAVPLLATAVFLYARGALDEMVYSTLLMNVSMPVHPGRRIAGVLAFAVIAPPLALRGRSRLNFNNPLVSHLALFAAWYSILLLCFWPLLTSRDFLPLVPLGTLVIASTSILPVLIFIAATLLSVWIAELQLPRDVSRQRFIDDAVRLTRPDEYVFDIKGNAVFRRRPSYTIYDIVGRSLTNNGTLPDRAPEDIVARRCCVAIDDLSHIPQRTRAFLNRHFIDHGAVRVCGAVVRDGAFSIAVPEVYAVVARHPRNVVVDGVPYRGPRFLDAGPHTLTSSDSEPVTVIWSRAAQEGL